jgi:hypothetical protein
MSAAAAAAAAGMLSATMQRQLICYADVSNGVWWCFMLATAHWCFIMSAAAAAAAAGMLSATCSASSTRGV